MGRIGLKARAGGELAAWAFKALIVTAALVYLVTILGVDQPPRVCRSSSPTRLRRTIVCAVRRAS